MMVVMSLSLSLDTIALSSTGPNGGATDGGFAGGGGGSSTQQLWHGQPKCRSSEHDTIPNSSHARHVLPRQLLPHSSGHDVGMGGLLGGGGGAGGASGGGGGGGGRVGGSCRQQPEQSQSRLVSTEQVK